MTTSAQWLAMACLAACTTTSFANSSAAAPQGGLAAGPAPLALGFESTYEMSSGRMLVVSPVGDVLWVRYGRRPAATLYPQSQRRFVSRDGRLALDFDVNLHGDIQQVALSMPADWR